MVYVVRVEPADTHQKLTLFSPLCYYSNTDEYVINLSIYTTEVMNSSDWLARRSFKLSRVLFNSEQPKRNKKIFEALKFWPELFKTDLDSAIHWINHFPKDKGKVLAKPIAPSSG